MRAGEPGRRAIKRSVDLIAGTLGLLVLSPVLAVCCVLIWLQDRHNPLYIAVRVGRGGRPFRMVKLRSMIVRADRTGIDSTAVGDPRITRLGRVIRKFKLDELGQLWNVMLGHMSLVGPRPQVPRDVALYTTAEKRLLEVRPGITDFASIVFADEGDILAGADDPDLRYNQLIRPWKSRLGLHYVEVNSTLLDIQLVLVTLLNSVSRRRALAWVAAMLEKTGADRRLVEVARRRRPLAAEAPPGAQEIVRSRVPKAAKSL